MFFLLTNKMHVVLDNKIVRLENFYDSVDMIWCHLFWTKPTGVHDKKHWRTKLEILQVSCFIKKLWLYQNNSSINKNDWKI